MENTNVHEVYNKIASHFSDTRVCHWVAVKNFINSLPAYTLLADIGCGNGKYFNVRNDITIIGNDACIPLLEIANIQPINHITNVCISNTKNLPYRNNSFSAIMSIAVLHHLSTIESRKQMLNEIYRVMDNNAIGLITVWATEMQIPKKWIKINASMKDTDYYVPWTDIKSKLTIKPVFNRYYHLFSKDETHDLVKENTGFQILDLFFEKDNWVIKFKKM